MSIFKESNGAVTFAVKVVPRASKNLVTGIEGDAIKIRLNAPPVDGKANDECVRFFAEFAGVPRARVRIVTGATSRIKVVEIEGMEQADFERRLAQPAG